MVNPVHFRLSLRWTDECGKDDLGTVDDCFVMENRDARFGVIEGDPPPQGTAVVNSFQQTSCYSG